MRARRAQSGFTLIELMISLVLFSVAIAGVLSVALTMSSGYRDQRALVQTESAARSPMDFLTDALRNASPGASSGVIVDTLSTGSACVNEYAISAVDGGATGTDSLDVIYASGGIVTSTRVPVLAGTSTFEVTDASGLSPGDYIVVADFSVGALFKISSIATTTAPAANITVTAPTCTSLALLTGTGFPAGSLVIRAMHAKFYVGSVDTVPNLMMQTDPDSATPGPSEPVTDGIEDLQVALMVQLPAPLNTVSWVFDNVGDVLPALFQPVAVRVTLVARAVNANASNLSNATFVRPAIEDHNAGTADIYRRRILKSTVEIRNVQGGL